MSNNRNSSSRYMQNARYIAAGLSDADMLWMLSVGKLRLLKQGEKLVTAGKALTDIYFITGGRLGVVVDDGTRVAFGCTVDYALNGKPNTITLVGDDEADASLGLVAFTAPLARAMLDTEVGEAVDFAGKAEAIEILAIHVWPDLPA